MKLNKVLFTSLTPLALMPIIATTSCVVQSADFKTDSWEHVVSVTNQGFIAFAKTYIENKDYKSEDEAIEAINEWIAEESRLNQKISRDITLTINNIEYQTSVKLIGINHDILSDGSGKAKLTFDFNDILIYAPIDPTGQCPLWRYYDHNSTASECVDKILLPALPKVLQNSIKTVKKESIDYTKSWYDSLKKEFHLSYVYHDEKLCPLSLEEAGDRNLWEWDDFRHLYHPGGEGEQYKWFENLRNPNATAKRILGTSVVENYRYRTPFFKIFSPYGQGEEYATYTCSGLTAENEVIKTGFGISPMFCI